MKEENNKLEYKISLPTDNSKWLKSIVSFSNTSGGELVIGVDDKTKEIVGINESRSELETKIMDTIYNNIIPKPIVDIVFKNIEDKDILIIKVSRGNETPYFIKNKGIVEGTYVRFGSTDRVTTYAQLEEIKLSSKRESYTNLEFYENNKMKLISIDEINKFLTYLNKNNIERTITINKLLEWKLIKSNFDKYYATNGYMLLTDNPFNNSYIKIGLFNGNDKSNLISNETITGSLIEQYEKALKIINEMLYKGYSFKKIRKKEFMIPEVVIREVLANSIVHRNYLDNHPIRVEIYSDRVEFYSPGSLYDGLQLEDILSGLSKLRNVNIAEVFHSLGYIEKWGSGIQRSNNALVSANMNKLKIDAESIHGITVTIFFEILDDKIENEEKEKTNALDVLDFYKPIADNITRKKLEKDFNLTLRQARSILEELQTKNLIAMRGSGPSTYYEIINKDK